MRDDGGKYDEGGEVDTKKYKERPRRSG